jgi:NADH-quinone oxidoreductase subunit G
VASGRMTNEEAYLLKEIRKTLGGEAVRTDIVPHLGEADGILRSADLNPNTHGVTLFGLSNEGRTLAQIRKEIESGHIQALLVLHENLIGEAGWPAATLSGLKLLAVQALLKNATTDRADFVLPGASFAEKRGSMINGEGRLQRLNQAVSVPGLAMDDCQILLQLKSALGGGNGIHSIEEVFKAMAADTALLSGLSLSRIGDHGVKLQMPGAIPTALRDPAQIAKFIS